MKFLIKYKLIKYFLALKIESLQFIKLIKNMSVFYTPDIKRTNLYKLAYKKGKNNPNKELKVPHILYADSGQLWSWSLKEYIWTEGFKEGQKAACITVKTN